MAYEQGYTNDHEPYVRPIANDLTWTCVLCDIREDTIYIDEWQGTHIWLRYGLRCEHQAHDVCYRKWAETTGKVGCPCCGPLERLDTNAYCSRCIQFGHPTCQSPLH